jgi:hypothetical protein
MDFYMDLAHSYSISFIGLAKEWGSRAAAWAALQRSYGLPEEFMWSTGLGLVLATTVLVFGNKSLSPEEKKMRLRAIEEQDKPTFAKSENSAALTGKKEKGEGNVTVKSETKMVASAIDEVITPDMDVEEMVEKTEKLAKKFGATEKDVREAIEKVRDQQRRGLSAVEIEMEEPFMKSAVRGLEWIVYALCAYGFFYSVNIFTGGDAGRMLCGMFPREMELIGATEYLRSFGPKGVLPAASS